MFCVCRDIAVVSVSLRQHGGLMFGARTNFDIFVDFLVPTASGQKGQMILCLSRVGFTSLATSPEVGKNKSSGLGNILSIHTV